MQESPILKPELFGYIISFSIKREYVSLYIRRSNIFPKIGRNETGRLFLTFCLSCRLDVVVVRRDTTITLFGAYCNFGAFCRI